MGFSKKFCENVGKKITYKERRNDFPMSGVMVSCSEGVYGSATIKFVLDEPVERSLEKYGEVLYKQIQIRYESNGEINDEVFEDLTEPQRRTEQDLFQQFLGQRVSFTTTDNKTITDVIDHVGPHGIHVKDNIKYYYRYDQIMNLPTLAPPVAPPTAVVATEIPDAHAEIVRDPSVPIVEARSAPEKKGFFDSFFGKFGKGNGKGKRKSKKQRKQRKSKKQRKTRK